MPAAPGYTPISIILALAVELGMDRKYSEVQRGEFLLNRIK
jgi:hypothetical protein